MFIDNNIPQGYKQTELGIIPEDWEVKQIRDGLTLLTDFDANGSFADMAANVQTYIGGGYAWYVRATDLEQQTPLSEVKYVDESSYRFLKKSSLYGGEVLLAKRGDIGKVYLFEAKTMYATLAPNLYLLKLNQEIDSTYLYYYLKSNNGQKALKDINASTSLGALYKEDVKNLYILYPSPVEQRAIAAALSDIDRLIEALDKKIAKKRLIKQGAMQQLLTGKKRLPGFTDPWVEKRLGEIGVWVKGQSLSKNDIIPNGKNICIHYGELFSYGEVITLPVSRTNCQPTTISLGNEILFPDSDVTPDGLGRCSALLIKGVIIGSGINVLRHKPLYDTSFVSYSININRSKIIDRVTGTTVKHINSKELSEIMINIPKNKEEQTAIATILTDMDKEIADLEAKRDKYRLLKSGMMQKLLTGQIRLK